jgi:hypothetical protein
MVEQNLNY